jgi:hypothetical protein
LPEKPSLSLAPVSKTEPPAETPSLDRPSIATSKTLVVPEAEQEADVWYGGYAGRTMLPSLAICLGLTALMLWGVWNFWERWPSRWRGLVILAAAGVLGAIWIFQIIRWGYRKMATGTRLTSRRLFLDRGFLYPNRDTLPLDQIARVEVRRSIFGYCLRFGRIHIFSETKHDAVLVMHGVSRPFEVAERIRKQVARAREGQVLASRFAV